ncbi:fungal specific transcription factor domain-containing protein [Colletotrichum abscissum]|uniref:Fungal specific transcription factor domain-containing protein n=2 Tax=Colletotrichum acutatum species complex TaxID=2707335 RepID=A0A9P9XJ83_9PEZI|nr:fungal specific transcription factor domain-containing protein [Colletotrichum costaricense]XP_060401995.1 fungal specific transcription factor domain-containing protein [Colletotrichum abscissum]KAI3549658.1 fungal specific transcription factor domain-containing protein [Colletotrichum filicis]KAI3554202.1 fungal specific transcription factor domain-containing protein [Colletotrichum abscissum]KAK1507299.1 fungal specific transcription factor domain-containing protein [Colletotrichum abscis
MAPSISVPAQGGMFHTFQGVTPRKQTSESQEGGKSTSSSGSKRITTPHACAECKRRKIRCDGQQPCGQCLSSRAPKRCFYDKHRQRVIPSRKTLEALSQSLEECRSVLKRLFPHQDVQSLLPLSRHDLLGLLEHPVLDTPTALPSPPLNTSPLSQELDSPVCSGSERGFSSLELMPGRDTEWDEERRVRDPIPIEADDVNALSLSVDRQSSYLGASSIKAALMCLMKVQPALRNALTTPLQSAEVTHSFPSMRQRSAVPKDTQRIPWSWKGQTLIDAYFKRIHVFVPMLDEAAFRADYLEGQRFDAPWLALLNMVFAMGSIVAMKSDDYNHINYYNRAMEHLPMDAFGSSHIEMVQALALIGGYYLHYINRPNMANAVLGAAIRMASALGLHRESLAQGSSDIAAAETRRRTWWSLFCLDTWATTTMGRPSFGRWGPAINIRPPEFGISQGRDSAQHAGILPLIENIKFCKIATQIQDLLAISPLLRAEDRCNLDGQLVNWYSSLPWLLRTTDPCAEPLYIARCIMKWRYQNLRMLLHRPVLLSLASNGSLSHVAEQDVTAIETCRELAKQTIEDIAREWTRNQMSGWNAVWFLYQAAMIPLVSTFWEWNSPRVADWHQQIETILDLLEAMEDWSLAAKRSREVVWRMYEASRQPSMRSESPLQGLAGEQGMLMAEAELHMSPIGLEPEGMGMMGMLDQHGLWDMDGMYWGQGPDQAVDFSPYNVSEHMMHMDYGMMGSQVAGMEGGFFVH